MIKFIEKQNEPIALVCDKVDRLQRGFKEAPILDQLRKSGKLVLHFNVEGQILDSTANSAQLMSYHMHVMIAEYYTNNISDNVRRSFVQMRKDGKIVSSAPIGYLNSRDENNRGKVIIDNERVVFIKKIFEEYATGLYSLKAIREKTIEWGL